MYRQGYLDSNIRHSSRGPTTFCNPTTPYSPAPTHSNTSTRADRSGHRYTQWGHHTAQDARGRGRQQRIGEDGVRREFRQLVRTVRQHFAYR
jgi:hypothetical protein